MPSTAAAPTLPFTGVRPLPPEEYHRLAHFPIAERFGVPDPRAAQILVAEDPAGDIVGIWAALTTVHLDGLWIAPEYRRTSRVASQLLHGMKSLLRHLGIVHSFTMVAYDSPDVLILAQKAGFDLLPMHLCFLDLTREAPRAPEGVS